MKEFKCWDDGETDEDGAEMFDAPDASTAAEMFAEGELQNSAGECGNSVTAHVRCPDGSLEIYDVTIDYQPTFLAKKRAPIA